MSSTASDDGLYFGPTTSGKYYVSLFAHRKSRSTVKKTMWHKSVSPAVEYGIFVRADDDEWCDQNGDYWGLLDSGTKIIGLGGELICKFPSTKNVSTPWHGYPVSPMRREADAPPDEFIVAWIDSNVISLTLGRRIQRRKI